MYQRCVTFLVKLNFSRIYGVNVEVWFRQTYYSIFPSAFLIKNVHIFRIHTCEKKDFSKDLYRQSVLAK